jgi:hypothetical protein
MEKKRKKGGKRGKKKVKHTGNREKYQFYFLF